MESIVPRAIVIATVFAVIVFRLRLRDDVVGVLARHGRLQHDGAEIQGGQQRRRLPPSSSLVNASVHDAAATGDHGGSAFATSTLGTIAALTGFCFGFGFLALLALPPMHRQHTERLNRAMELTL
ncbi:hypothetical protein E2562_001058 [Oryza meyeriana var. granulata]|uniref:Uncharacterized protein n=1 Tax=Oryza meyeriana var. granulata TaxID=110450 RepID=A0A6G1ECY9_9ORYZ|nr:hypothetical protein E2562_001058 [Oryza meyeriana var. granulata]